ncbi:MAG: MFS transporter [Saprospiraceae bacterium]|nr:MFS transporter [Saprospiraceae bacterium]
MSQNFNKDLQYIKFCAYGFLKNLKFFEPFLILFFLEKGTTFFQIGILYTVREVTRNIFEIPAGFIADIFGRRRTMIFSFSLYIVSFLLFYIAKDYWILILAMILFSFGDAFRTGTHKAMIFEYLKMKSWENQKVHYYGHTRAWSQNGSAISSLLAALIIFYSGEYKYIFLFSIIPYILDLLLMISYPKELDGEMQKFDRKKLKEIFKKTIDEFKVSFKDAKVIKAIINTSVFSGYYRAVKDYLQPIVKTFALAIPVFLAFNDKQRSAIVIGIVYFIIYILSALTARNSGRFADKFRNIQKPLNLTLLIGFSISLISGIFYHYGFSLLAIVFYLGIYMIENLRKPVGIAYITDVLNKDILATALSVESQVKSLFAAAIAPLIGLFADLYGLGNSLVLVSVIMLVGLPFYLLGRK